MVNFAKIQMWVDYKVKQIGNERNNHPRLFIKLIIHRYFSKDKPFVVFVILDIQNIHPLNNLVHGS